jgi:hypothetical protein
MIARTRKGQYAVVEQVVLFALGIAIVSGFLTAFEDFGRDVKTDATEQQSELLSEVVGSHVTQIVRTRADGTVSFTMPESIAGDPYRINFTDSGVAVVVQERSHLTSVYGLTETYDLEGSISSEYQTAVISKEQDTITIGNP